MTTDTKVTFTPGPWTFEPGKVAPDNLGGTIKGPNGEYIASVQWRGNGPLLASAQELLRAAQTALDVLDHVTTGNVSRAECQNARLLLQAAILEATHD